MNSLEFIEKEIKSDEDFIKILRRDAQLGLKWENIDIGFFEKRIAHLQQIKTELEAWEVVKDKINVKEEPNYFYPQYCICLKYMNGKINKEQYERLKKALEVEECEK